jgi:hypothetical protein
MNANDKITNAYIKAFDKQRAVFYPLPQEPLTFFSHEDSVGDVIVAKTSSGWYPTAFKQAGQIEAKFRVDILTVALFQIDENDPLALSIMTLELAEMCHRLTYLLNGPTFVVTNFDRPADAPHMWTFWCQELVLGAIS